MGKHRHGEGALQQLQGQLFRFQPAHLVTIFPSHFRPSLHRPILRRTSLCRPNLHLPSPRLQTHWGGYLPPPRCVAPEFLHTIDVLGPLDSVTKKLYLKSPQLDVALYHKGGK